MFPFRPRKPMLGGKLTKKRKAEAAAVEEAATNGKVDGTDNDGKSNERHPKTPPEPRPKKPAGLLDDLRGGGPVERAIRSDLENLRTLFEEDCIRHEASLVAASARAAGGDATTCVAQHDDAGSWYLLFKSAYRRGKFGIMHTRCMPNRIERAEFAQMIYAACLGLFADAIEGVNASSSSPSSDAIFPPDAAFALFALYTLYETCPLPEFPSMAKVGDASHDTQPLGAVFSRQETSVLTTVPLGLTAAGEQSRVIYRRAYKSPIRIGHADYARILRLQDLCLERKSHCECRCVEWIVKVSSDSIDDDSDNGASGSPSSGNCASDRWTCRCGIAEDCLEIIHRLHGKHCFDFCEYAGPCSVEGFAGSAEYFDKVVANKMRSSSEDGSSLTSSDVLGAAQGAKLPLAEAASILDIDGLGDLYSEYGAALNKVQSVPSSEKPSNQARQVEKALRPVLRRRRRWSTQDESGDNTKSSSTTRLDDMLGKLRNGKIASDDITELSESSDEDGILDEEPARKSIWDHQADKMAGDEPLPVAMEQDDRVADSEHPRVRFKLPNYMPQSLRQGVQDALASVERDLDKSAEEQISIGEGVPVAIGGADVRTFMSMEMFDLEGVDLAPNIHDDADDDVETVITHHTGQSVIPPTGAADALRDLLAFARGEESDDGADGGGDDDEGGDDNDNNGDEANADVNAPVQNDKSKRQLSRKRKQKQQETPDDDISMVSVPSTAGGAINALGSLLSQVQSDPAKSKASSAPRGRKIAKSKRTPKAKSRRQRHTSNDNDDVSKVSAPLASGGGGNALGDLLSRAKKD